MDVNDNTQRAYAIFDAFGRGDIPYILGELTNDSRFTSHLDPIVPWAGDFVGKDNVVRYFQALGGSVEVIDHPVSTVVAQGDTVVAMGEVSFRVRETGKAGSSAWVYIFTFANGQLESFTQFNDQGLAEAFR